MNVKWLLGALITVIGLSVLFPRVVVYGDSMEPTYQQGDWLLTMRRGSVERSDVVIVRTDTHTTAVKRVIGLPGDVIEYRNGYLYRNAQRQFEFWTLEPFARCDCRGVWSLEADQYFVMGDNRHHSYDSRDYGPVDQKQIIARVLIEYLSGE